MKNREKRVKIITDLISSNCIGSQDELLKLLAEHGYSVTQATLSRDLKAMKITKIPLESGGYIYVLPESKIINDYISSTNRSAETNDSNTGAFVSLTFSGNIALIKTRYGYAPGLAFDIDLKKFSEILGTVPGNDTIIAVLREGVSHEQARRALSRILPLSDTD